MKIFYKALMSALFVILVAACSGNSGSRLDEACKKMNELCPQEVPSVGTVTEFVIDNNMLTIVCNVTNKDITYADMEADKDNIREQIKKTVATISRGKVLDILREGDTGICYRYVWPDGKNLDISYSFTEIEQLTKK